MKEREALQNFSNMLIELISGFGRDLHQFTDFDDDTILRICIQVNNICQKEGYYFREWQKSKTSVKNTDEVE